MCLRILIGNHQWPGRLHFVKRSQSRCTLLSNKLQRFTNLKKGSMSGGMQYSVEYENHFYIIFFCVYLLAECHNKVATNIFYFAGAGISSIVERDHLCFFQSTLPPASPIQWLTFPQLRRGQLPLKLAFEKSFGLYQNTRLSEQFEGQKFTNCPIFILAF